MFSELIKDLRGKTDLSQGKLAKAIGVSPGNVSDWEMGKTKPGYNALVSLARFFGVSADYLLEIENRDNSSSSVSATNSCEEIECDLLSMFRFLDEQGQEDVIDFVTMKYEKATGEKESIYWTYIEDKKEREKKAIRQNDEENSGTA